MAVEQPIKVSIIVTCYNLERFIGDCIKSLLNQDCGFGYEIILINDCSTDNSLQKIREFSSPKIHLIDNEVNLGAAVSVTNALKVCKGEYLCRFDGDDMWPPHFLSTAAQALDQHPGVSLVYSDVSIIDQYGKIVSVQGNINRKSPDTPVLQNELVDILREYYINAPTIMFRRQAFARAFPLPDLLIQKRNFIDWYISLIVLQNGTAYFINKPLAFYRIHASNNHTIIIMNRVVEEVTEFILQQFNRSERITRVQRKSIAAYNYKALAEQYFGFKMFSDAQRNYKKALMNAPGYFFNVTFMKHFAGTFIGFKFYEKTRNLFSGRKMRYNQKEIIG